LRPGRGWWPRTSDDAEKSVHDTLDEWPDAERDAENEPHGSAAERMARKRANHARDEFHEREDEEHERKATIDRAIRLTSDGEANPK
jgi:hypothetical protein